MSAGNALNFFHKYVDFAGVLPLKMYKRFTTVDQASTSTISFAQGRSLRAIPLFSYHFIDLLCRLYIFLLLQFELILHGSLDFATI